MTKSKPSKQVSTMVGQPQRQGRQNATPTDLFSKYEHEAQAMMKSNEKQRICAQSAAKRRQQC
jgi:hypothetical protein